MALKAAWLTIALTLSVVASPGATAWGQPSTSPPEHKTSFSSGIKATPGNIKLASFGANQEAIIPIELENVTKDRIYLFVVGDRRASVSDGNSLRLQEAIGLTFCNMLYPQEVATKLCIDRNGIDLNYYSYIESGEKLEISLRYLLDHVKAGYTPSGSISFRLMMVSRVAHAAPGSPEVQADPKNITTPQLVIFNFPPQPLAQ